MFRWRSVGWLGAMMLFGLFLLGSCSGRGADPAADVEPSGASDRVLTEARAIETSGAGEGVIELDDEVFMFSIDSCSLDPFQLTAEDLPDDGEGHVPLPSEPIDIALSVTGYGSTDDGQEVAVDIDRLGGPGSEMIENIRVVVGPLSRPVRSWEAFHVYDPDTGEATTFRGEPAEPGPILVVEEAVVSVAGDFIDREGPADAETAMRGVIVANCASAEGE